LKNDPLAALKMLVNKLVCNKTPIVWTTKHRHTHTKWWDISQNYVPQKKNNIQLWNVVN